MSHLVIYHKSCMDGLVAALAVRQCLWDSGQMRGSKFITAQYGDDWPTQAANYHNIIIVDFSYPRDTLERVYQHCTEKGGMLTVIDHHQTAEEALKGLPYCIFDMDHSGAVLAWKHFHPDKPMPKLFEYVEDRDLWKWKLPFSREISAALRSHKPFLNHMERYLDDAELSGLVSEGAAILRIQNQHIEKILNDPPGFEEIGGYRVPCINTTTLISEIGNELAEGHPFAAMYFDTSDKRVFSLRSVDGGIDVSEIAKQYGGGGHPRSAGFSIDKPNLWGDG